MDDLKLDYEPHGNPYWYAFVHYVLPWLVLLSICFGLYLCANYILQALFLLSEPVSKVLP